MNLARRILIVTFIESFATICVERGIFFFAYRHLGFSETANLTLSLSFGVLYVLGALLSHPLCARIGERRLLQLAVFGQLVVHLGLALNGRQAGWLFLLNAGIGFLNGIKWPIVESYMSAGLDAEGNADSIGRFNLAWASAVPLALVFTGPVNTYWAAGLFLVPALVNAVAMTLVSRLPAQPPHIANEHPSRPPVTALARLWVLLIAARWLLALSYACMWILSALFPAVLERVGAGAALAPGLSGLLDLCRVAAFFTLWRWRGWIGRRVFLVAAVFILPASFLAATVSSSLWLLLLSEVAFGFCMGTVYHAAIYYAMVVKNASVDAGGGHEALIGAGFTLGPCIGLLSVWLTPIVGSRLSAMLIGSGPLALLCGGAALIALFRANRLRV